MNSDSNGIRSGKSTVVVLTGMSAVVIASAIAVWAVRARAAAPPQVVYVCTETNDVYTGAPQVTPALNPATGRRTLMSGVYCPECQRWYAVPGADHRAGNPQPMKCRIHGVPLTFNDDASAPIGPGRGAPEIP